MIRPVFILIFMIFSHCNVWADANSCACEKTECGPCQKAITVGTNVKFCNWGDINVCRETVCENVSFYFSCLSKLEEKEKDAGAGSDKDQLTLDYEEDRKAQQKIKPAPIQRKIASVKKVIKKRVQSLKAQGRKEVGNTSRVMDDGMFSNVLIGRIEKSTAGLQVFHRGQTRSLKNKEKIYVGDEVSNSSGSVQRFTLNVENGQVRLELHDKTKITIEDPHSILGHFQPFAYLVYGGLDFKLELKKGSFDLLAGQVLIRAQEGHQQVSYQMEDRGLTVRVESLKGGLQVIRARDLSGQSITVEAGQFVSWISETPNYLFNRDEKMALVGEGFITPVFVMTPQRKKELGVLPVQEAPLFADWTQRKSEELSGAERGLASLGGELCQSPSAAYEQCAWTCEGNPTGATQCQAEKSNIHCVRRQCNAAGQWGSPTPFASSYRDLCPAQGVRVGGCGP